MTDEITESSYQIKTLREENERLRGLLFERSRTLAYEGQPPEPIGDVCNICGAFGETHNTECVFYEKVNRR